MVTSGQQAMESTIKGAGGSHPTILSEKEDCYDNNGHRKRGCSREERDISISSVREESE